MRKLKCVLLEAFQYYGKILEISKGRLANAPEGSLRLSTSKNRVQYYHFTGEKNRGSYIAKEDGELVKKLAQKGYDEKVVRLAGKRIRQIEDLLKSFDENEIDEIFNKEHEERQKLIEPAVPTWQQIVNEWKAKEYKGKDFHDDVPIILTERGERVRSKSEKILADYFYRHGLEYKYECPIYLKGVGTIYPDFTFLSPWTKKEIYWEHNGKMDDPGYAKKAIRRIQAYENNGIFPGENLILTYETEQNILSTSKIKQLAERYLI